MWQPRILQTSNRPSALVGEVGAGPHQHPGHSERPPLPWSMDPMGERPEPSLNKCSAVSMQTSPNPSGDEPQPMQVTSPCKNCILSTHTYMWKGLIMSCTARCTPEHLLPRNCCMRSSHGHLCGHAREQGMGSRDVCRKISLVSCMVNIQITFSWGITLGNKRKTLMRFNWTFQLAHMLKILIMGGFLNLGWTCTPILWGKKKTRLDDLERLYFFAAAFIDKWRPG